MRKKADIKNDEKSFPKMNKVILERKKCECMAQKHGLINNCLNCGRVICQIEGEGPCMFCSNIVHRPQTQFVDRDDASLFPTLNEQQLKKVLIERSEAIKHKNILVDRDASNNVNQNIYDEQTDYYELSQNQWASQEDRKKAVQRIITEQKMVKVGFQTNAGHYDVVTQQWVKDQFKYDETQFKKEAQNFIKEAETREIKKKMQRAKDVTFDDRLNQNAKQIFNQIKQQLEGSQKGKRPKTANKNLPKFKAIELIEQ